MSDQSLRKAERAAMLQPRRLGGVLLTFAIVVLIAGASAALDFAMPRTGVPVWERPGAALVIGAGAGIVAALVAFVLRFLLGRGVEGEGGRDAGDRA